MKPISGGEEVMLGIVVSQFNKELTSALLAGTRERLAELAVPEKNLKIVEVPGAVEIPLTAQWLAKSKKYHALICLGVVIRGETSHYDYVCSQVSEGCQQVMLSSEVPVIFGVLTTENEEQAWARVGGKEGHKGHDVADAALQMIAVLRDIASSS